MTTAMLWFITYTTFNPLEGIKVDTDLLIDDNGYSVDDYFVDCCATSVDSDQ